MNLFAVISFTESNKQIIISCIKDKLKLQYVMYKDVVVFASDKTQNDLTKTFDNALITKLDFMLISINHMSGRVDDNISEFVRKVKVVTIEPAPDDATKNNSSGPIL